MSKVKSWGLVSLVLAMVFAAAMLMSANTAWAATATTQENTPYEGMDFFALDGSPAYCGERRKGVPTNESYTVKATTADGYAVNSQDRDEKDWWRGEANHWDEIKHILYVGYPNDAAGLGADVDTNTFRAATQEAVWYYTNSLPLSDNDAGRLAQKIIDDTTAVPASATLNFWVADNKSGNQSMFTLTVSDEPTTDPTITNTTLTANGTAAGDSAAQVSVKVGDEVTLTDTITLENIDKDYTIVCEAYNVDAPNDPVSTGEASVAAGDTTATVTLEKLTMSTKGTFTYSIKTILKDGDEEVTSHNDAFDIASETVKVTVTEKETPTPEPVTNPSIGTTISANGIEAEDGSVLHLESSGTVNLKDSINYSGLKKGTTYYVKGTLYKVVDGVESGDAIATKTGRFEATSETTGTAKDAVDFGEVALEDNAAYVVFEELFSDEDCKEAVTDSTDAPVVHKEPTDPSQVIVVGEGWKEIWDEEPSFTPVTSDDPVPAAQPTLSTSVKAGTKVGTSAKAATLTSAEAAKLTSITDTITYKNFTAGEKVSVTGTLYSSKDGKNFTEVTGAKTEGEFEVSTTGSGDWTMTFNNVKLEAGTTYVVAESATRADGSVVEHKDFTDKAQTIVVAAAPATSASQTAKTADAASGATLMAIFVAVASATLAFGARRKNER
ncbi:MAG: VaFE repeat-containing surface-anchored protein [Eggerthellaceae bacterium]|nr:VaFE repeat-containing surface-anchored protein [Eggerthellaceae bacterium]